MPSLPHAESDLGDGAASRLEREHFDRVALETGEFNPFSDSGWAALADEFGAAAPPGRRLEILDVGCGTGESRRIYRDRALRYLGLDLAFGTVRVASRRFADDRWLQADAGRLPFADLSQDIVAFSSVLHHLPSRKPALLEAMRVLRPHGLLFAFDPNLLHPPMALFRHPRSPLYLSAGVSPIEKPLLARTLRRELRDLGYSDIRIHGRSGVAYRTVAPRLLDAALSAYNLADSVLQASGLGRWLGSFLLTSARKPAG